MKAERSSQHKEGVNCPEHKTAGVISRGFFSPLIFLLSKYSSSSMQGETRTLLPLASVHIDRQIVLSVSVCRHAASLIRRHTTRLLLIHVIYTLLYARIQIHILDTLDTSFVYVRCSRPNKSIREEHKYSHKARSKVNPLQDQQKRRFSFFQLRPHSRLLHKRV